MDKETSFGIRLAELKSFQTLSFVVSIQKDIDFRARFSRSCEHATAIDCN